MVSKPSSVKGDTGVEGLQGPKGDQGIPGLTGGSRPKEFNAPRAIRVLQGDRG